ncbi:MAG: hypothetical protein ACI4UC_02035, partial [Alloprevotella sp.]
MAHRVRSPLKNLQGFAACLLIKIHFRLSIYHLRKKIFAAGVSYSLLVAGGVTRAPYRIAVLSKPRASTLTFLTFGNNLPAASVKLQSTWKKLSGTCEK